MRNIGVEKGLASVKDYLDQRGYMTSEIDLSQKNDLNFINGFDAIVLTGMDDNFLGMQDILTKVPVIEAAGLTPDDIVSIIEGH